LAEHASHDWRAAELEPRVHALCELAEQLTRKPASIGPPEVARLRAVGLADTEIHDAIQVIAYFNYVNRVADAVGIPDEPEWAEP
jgi:uncharacterized peroxidase-related enzyme